MKLIRYPGDNSRQETRHGTALTIGNFDGLHRGHQALLNRVTTQARQHGWQSAVVTMQPLAAQYFGGKEHLTLLTPFKDKARLLANSGVDLGVFLNFNRKLAELPAEDFAEKMLFDRLNARHIVVGDDFRFGKDRAGDFALLHSLAGRHGISVESIPSVLHRGQRISSSLIRRLLRTGDLAQANAMLGRPFAISGRVRRGRQLGRRLDMPTINLAVRSPQPPVQGVFAVQAALADGRILSGVASLGTNPTIAGTDEPRHILETHLFDFDETLYGQPVTVMFMQKLRDEVKFDGLPALKAQMQRDADNARAFFRTHAAGDTG